MRKELIEYKCPACNARYGSSPRKAGHSVNCVRCNSNIVIPVGLSTELVSVLRPAVIAEVMRPETATAPGTVPVRMEMPFVPAALSVPVDQQTANSMAKVFLGGLMVVIGVVLAATLRLVKRA